jgi:hypothetical protein
MSLLEKIDQLSFVKIIAISFLLVLIASLPIVIILSQQQTEIRSKAYEKPTLKVEKEKISPGPIPENPPKIGRIFPWIGKIGDIIWIQGENFGNNPSIKRLIIGGVALPEEMITSWQDNEIQAIIPEGAKQGGEVQVRVGQHPLSSSLPFVLYDKNTKTKLAKKGNLISILNGETVFKANVWMGDENTPTEKIEIPIENVSGKETQLVDIAGKPILTILLYDNSGQILPYYVDPTEFGF